MLFTLFGPSFLINKALLSSAVQNIVVIILISDRKGAGW